MVSQSPHGVSSFYETIPDFIHILIKGVSSAILLRIYKIIVLSFIIILSSNNPKMSKISSLCPISHNWQNL